jgi:hypothetical protein
MEGTMTPITYDERNALVHAVTAYDLKQMGKRGYNIYALPQYLLGIDRVCNATHCGVTRREALLDAFCGRLLDVCLKVLKMDKSTDQEQRGSL